jgi:NAD(P)-dependent dehydrogenase (short-subunit alcohol dehydrogenase family)
VVTGGASGIGLAAATLLAARGARVIVFDLKPEVAEPLSGIAADVTDDSSVRDAVAAGLPNRALYSASKGAVLALTMAMAADHVREGIRVNCVNPGTADTPWVGRLLDVADDPAAERAALEARQPMGRLVSADEVAHAIAYLASPLSGSTTGTAIAVDGGMQNLRLPAARS